jgi:predicted CoA-binding protein
MRSVAVLGASTDRSKYGNKAVRAFRQQGFRVYPINPRVTEVEGLTSYPDLAQVPERPDLVTVYLPPETVLGLLPAIAAKGCSELWLNPGAESAAVLARAHELGLNVIQACSVLGIGLSPETL